KHTMKDLHYLSISELAKQLSTRKLSSVEIVQMQLKRISRLDSELQAYASVNEDAALLDAKRADQEISRGNYRGPIHGVPIALKDLIFTQGIPTMGGTAVLKHFVPKFDATVVTKLRAAGAVIIGKLNLAEGAMAGYNASFSAPYNPLKRTLSPGGSSSGSGVATAAGLCFGSLGTDTGGSIRFPASMCGVVGMKPTWGRVSRHGIHDLAPSMDHVGSFTRTVGDAAIMIGVIAGYDPQDSTTMPANPTNFATLTQNDITKLRIGYAEHYATEGVDPATAQAVASAVDVLGGMGTKIVNVEIPNLDKYVIAWRDLCTAEAFVAHAQFFPSRSAEYGPWFRSWLAHGKSRSAKDYILAHQLRLECNAVIATAFSKFDVLLCPAMIAPEQRKSDAQNYTEPMGEISAPRQRFTIPYNFNGAPSITLPAGKNHNGDPISIQCIGKPTREDHVFKVAAALEKTKIIYTTPPTL
ncbi:MAG TPA: Asp-tRNA(Asn)/Glu-tRNA(Gln) amidotransferase GatCAB subunit A, partial [Gammaproteobacteria bacterium]|nr:Asp-tRNA(Asn)/Glu-tRNA(Gln) amidotransferase GatCAB subunit A [Gammaproteobacteria bacterium]